MRWSQRSTTTKGTTLVEVSITSTIFLGMTTVLLALLLQNQRSGDKVMLHTDVTTEMTLVFEKIRNEVRQSRVFGTDSAGALKYWKLRTVNGIPKLDADGAPDWLPGAPAAPDVALLRAENHKLVRTFQGQRQVLAQLGKDTSLTFAWNAGDHTLTLSGELGQKDQYSGSRNNVQVFKYNMYVGTSD